MYVHVYLLCEHFLVFYISNYHHLKKQKESMTWCNVHVHVFNSASIIITQAGYLVAHTYILSQLLDILTYMYMYIHHSSCSPYTCTLVYNSFSIYRTFTRFIQQYSNWFHKKSMNVLSTELCQRNPFSP